MKDISTAIAQRQNEVARLEAEIDALNQVGELLGRTGPRKRASGRKRAVAATASKRTSAPRKKRRKMSLAEKKAVSERMKVYWAKRRKKTAKRTGK